MSGYDNNAHTNTSVFLCFLAPRNTDPIRLNTRVNLCVSVPSLSLDWKHRVEKRLLFSSMTASLAPQLSNIALISGTWDVGWINRPAPDRHKQALALSRRISSEWFHTTSWCCEESLAMLARSVRMSQRMGTICLALHLPLSMQGGTRN